MLRRGYAKYVSPNDLVFKSFDGGTPPLYNPRLKKLLGLLCEL